MTDRPRATLLALARLLPALVLAGVLCSLATTPDLRFVEDAGEDLLVRKMGHAAVYGVLAVLYSLGVPALVRARAPVAAAWAIPLVLVAAVALVDELIQSRTLGRQGKLTDVLIDMSGALTALVLLRSVRHRSPRLAVGLSRARDGARDTGRSARRP